MINQALNALRELLAPSNTNTTGHVVGASSGTYMVATKRGTHPYPAAPGVTPFVGQRVMLQNGLIVRVSGTNRPVPTFHV